MMMAMNRVHSLCLTQEPSLRYNVSTKPKQAGKSASFSKVIYVYIPWLGIFRPTEHEKLFSLLADDPSFVADLATFASHSPWRMAHSHSIG